jgi:hypothetical protein
MTKDEKHDTPKFYCALCEYKCGTTFLWKQHSLTRKHESRANISKCSQHKCSKCDVSFSSRQSAHRHKKICEGVQKNDQETELTATETAESTDITIQLSQCDTVTNNICASTDEMNYKEMFITLIEENKELRKTIQELIPKIGNNTNTNTTNNNFNLNVFLNEECKDALNMDDFVELMKVQLNDLNMTGKLGYVEGMSRVFARGLKELDVRKRPIHCSDIKREILYVKDQNVWEKESDNKSKIKKMIKKVENKKINQVHNWIEMNPGCKDGTSKINTTFLHIMKEITGGDCDQEESNVNKIIRNIAKEVVINKCS